MVLFMNESQIETDGINDISDEDMESLTIVENDEVLDGPEQEFLSDEEVVKLDTVKRDNVKKSDVPYVAMSVLEFLEQPQHAVDFVKEKCITKILRESKIAFQHRDDAEQDILITWMSNIVKEGFDIVSVVSFACKIGQQTCYGFMREMTGALKIPRRVVQEHKEQDKKLVTDVVDFAIVNENEVAEHLTNESCPLFKLPIQNSLFPLPRIDQHIERELNAGEAMSSVLERTGYEKRALQGRLINLTKADEEYVEMVHVEMVEKHSLKNGDSGFTQRFLFELPGR